MPSLDVPEDAFFEWLIAKPGAILVVVVLAVVIRWLAVRFVNRIIQRAVKGVMPSLLGQTKAGAYLADRSPGASQRRSQRTKAIGSLLRSIITGIVLAISLVTILAILGVPVAPLLTSAGILGVALGFGAQTLVKDFLAGIFMILEDQYGIGDVIDVGEASGTVEAVGLRITQLRDVNGTVWYVRNGEIVRVGNSSQNWARAVLDITVGYETDLERAAQILHEEAVALAADETHRRLVLEEPEIWGVERFDHDGVAIRLVVKTVPLEQWGVARALRLRIKTRFDAEGIRMPTSIIPEGSA